MESLDGGASEDQVKFTAGGEGFAVPSGHVVAMLLLIGSLSATGAVISRIRILSSSYGFDKIDLNSGLSFYFYRRHLRRRRFGFLPIVLLSVHDSFLSFVVSVTMNSE